MHLNSKQLLRVTVTDTDCGHSGKEVQVTPSIHIPQPLHVALMDKYWLFVRRHLHGHGVAVVFPDMQHLLGRHALRWNNGRDAQSLVDSMLCASASNA